MNEAHVVEALAMCIRNATGGRSDCVVTDDMVMVWPKNGTGAITYASVRGWYVAPTGRRYIHVPREDFLDFAVLYLSAVEGDARSIITMRLAWTPKGRRAAERQLALSLREP